MSFQFNLTNIRFEDVRAQIVEFLKSNSEYSATFDWTASNLGYIIDTMAYVTMLMSYEISNVANNNFLDTTNIRKNAVSIAKSLGYRPKRMKSARIDGVIKYYDPTFSFTDGDYITIPAKSVFSSSAGKTFLNIEPIVLYPATDNPNLLQADFSLIEGSFKNYSYLGTGLAGQSFVIPSAKVEDNNFQLYVREADESNSLDTRWTEVKNIFNIVESKIYFIEEDIVTEGFPRVVFGDGVIGAIPNDSQIISIEYLESAGSAANGEYLMSIPNVYELSDNLINNIAFTFEADNFTDYSDNTNLSFGGKDIETLAEIQFNAPKSFAAAGRAVTKDDYINLLNNYPYIYKGNAIGGDELFNGDSTKLGNIYITGVPYCDLSNFTSNKNIYLTNLQEATINYDFSKYNIISTKLNFFKPSYIYVDIYPSVELANNISLYDETLIKSTIVENLSAYINTNYMSFNALFRESKLNTEIDRINGVISASLNCKYSFVINYDTFYDMSNSESNFVYLPVKVDSFDKYGNPFTYTNFVQTNKEYAESQNLISIDNPYNSKTTVPLEERTIFGQLYHPSVTRYMYNEDIIEEDDSVLRCYVKLHGENTFFQMYRFNSDLTKNDIPDTSHKIFYNGVDTSTLEINGLTAGSTVPDLTEGAYQYDEYVLGINDIEIGKITRNHNQEYNKGPVISVDNITVSPTNAQFHEIWNTFEVTGTDKDFSSVTTGDVIIYNATSTKWQKGVGHGIISATTDEGLFTARTQNEIFGITGPAGSFNGLMSQTVSAGDHIIFNLDSVINPDYKWEKLNQKFPQPGNSLVATMQLPKAAVPYDIKLITNVDVAGTNFGGRSSRTFYENDLIFYTNNPGTGETSQWQKLINVSSSAELSAADSVYSMSLSALEIYDYTPGGLAVGTFMRVADIGNFPGSTDRIIWNNIDTQDQIAFINDIIVYVGDGLWKIFSNSYSNLFAIDGAGTEIPPITLTYGDIFSIAGTGNFADDTGEVTYTNTDKIVYIGDDTWQKFALSSPTLINPSSSANLPTEAELGDILYINEDGNFNNSILINPAGQSFVQGDKIIFTGSYWIQLHEYTFEYYDIPPSNILTGKDILNNLGFNSVFYYTYDPLSRYYSFKFNDIYHEAILGEFRYNISVGDETTKYDVGKLLFSQQVSGMYDDLTPTSLIPIRNIFNNYDINNTMDKIYVTPKNIKNENDVILSARETDFDVTFNQIIIAKINEIVKK